eukprot:gene7491-8322_t
MLSSEKSSLSRSLSETADRFTYSDDALKDIFFDTLSELWKSEEGLFFDVDLVAKDGSVHKAHRLVLACVSPYFRSAFSPKYNGELKTRIELTEIDASTLDLIREYIYTSNIVLTGETVQDLIVAANYLQLSSLEKGCTQFISQNTDESNIADVITFADQIGLLGLQTACRDYIRQNVGKILLSPSWLQFPVHLVESVLMDDSVFIHDAWSMLPPSSMQERILFEAVVKYVQNSSIVDPYSVVDTLKQLLKNVRLHLILKYEHESIRKIIDACENEDVKTVCQEIISPFSTGVPGTLQLFQEKQMPLPRNFSVMKPRRNRPLADVNGYQGTFFDELEGVPRYLKGMKIWIRRWDGRPVYGAIEVLYSDGKKIFHGERSNNEVYEFMLEPDEYIIKVISFAGFMVDSLEFFTNKGRNFGPYGGDGGGKQAHPPGSKHGGYLSFVSGAEAMTQGALGIVSLVFHWIIYDPDSKFDRFISHNDYSNTLDDSDHSLDTVNSFGSDSW